MRIKNTPRFSSRLYDILRMQIRDLDRMTRQDKGQTVTTDSQHEATGRPSETIDRPPDRRAKVGAYKFSVDENGKLQTYCSRCKTQINTMQELFNHYC